ncbi:MAG: prolyl-tRNA synthetase associated domain-containing protein, partial [Christensenellaceae bacterium]|nr:prolyl-tRNA synthetase associated domain-containing protein [Christensenellaceae bacterium]
KGDKRVNLKDFRRAHGTRPLSFASSEDLLAIMKLEPGAVTPLGLLNDDDIRIEFYLDKSFLEGDFRIGCHPNDNTATIWLNINDLIKIIKEHGNIINVVEI